MVFRFILAIALCAILELCNGKGGKVEPERATRVFECGAEKEKSHNINGRLFAETKFQNLTWEHMHIYFDAESFDRSRYGREISFDKIWEAIEVLQDLLQPCNVTFHMDSEPVTDPSLDYVYVFYVDDCSSDVGRVGGRQNLSLGDGCHHDYIVQHEFLHALGFSHTHRRPDRDDYVTMYWENIQPEFQWTFSITEFNETILYGEYDYESIMHYDSWAFSNWKGPTMLKKNGDFISDPKVLSEKDKIMLVKRYCGEN